MTDPSDAMVVVLYYDGIISPRYVSSFLGHPRPQLAPSLTKIRIVPYAQYLQEYR